MNKKKEISFRYNDLLKTNGIIPSDSPWSFPKQGIKSYGKNYGWKIHISASIVNLIDIIQTFFIINKELKLDFKILSSLSVIEGINIGRYGNSQVGKIITIYPKQAEVEKVLKRLSYAFKKYSGISVGSDYQFMLSENIYYRYGTLTEDIFNIDRRNKTLLPSKIPIMDLKIKRYNALPDRYIILSILSQTGTKAVYLGLDLDGNKKIIIRYATPLHDIDLFGIDSVDRLNNCLEILQDEKHTSLEKVVDSFYLERSFVLITEKVDGLTLESFFKTYPETSDVVKLKIFKKIVYIINFLHKKSIIFRDLSFKNLIINPYTHAVTLIDFEYAVKINELASYGGQKISVAGTYGFFDYNYPYINKSVDNYGLSSILYYLFNFKEYLNYTENMKPETSLDEIKILINRRGEIPNYLKSVYDKLKNGESINPSDISRDIID